MRPKFHRYSENFRNASKKDFRNKIFISKKESKETKYWLRMISRAEIKSKEKARKLWQEAHELSMIFSKIITNISKGM